MKLKNIFFLLLFPTFLSSCIKDNCQSTQEPIFNLYVATPNNLTLTNISLKNAIKQPNINDGVVGLDMNKDTTTLQITLSDNSIHNVVFAYTRNIYYKSKECGFVIELNKNKEITFVPEKSSDLIGSAKVNFKQDRIFLLSPRNETNRVEIFFK